MARVLVPSNGPGDWRCLLADPKKHWARGYSARTLAHCWEDTDGFPPEVHSILSQHPALKDAEPLLIFPEWQVALPGGSRPSQNDIWVLAKGQSGLISITVEGKVDEPFDMTIEEWKADASRGKQKRLDYLTRVLSLSPPIPGSIRYQLIHRAASAVIEAERFGAGHAVLLVHSFSRDNLWFQDFAAFASLFGLSVKVDRLSSVPAGVHPQLHFGWVSGDKRYLNA